MHTVYRGGPGLVAIGTSCDPLPDQGVCSGGAEVAIWTSPDGLNWTRLEQVSGDFASYLAKASESEPSGRLFLESVAGNESGFVGATPTTDGFEFWTSQDGIEWSKRPSMDTTPQTCFQWLDSRIVAAETSFVAWRTCNDWQDSDGEQDAGFSRYYSTVWTSTDGTSWSTTQLGTDMLIEEVIAVGDTFIAVGTSGDLSDDTTLANLRPAIWTSTDGLTWVQVNLAEDPSDSGKIVGVELGGPGLVAYGQSPEGPTLWVAVPDITP
jgi:hypothetical protein